MVGSLCYIPGQDRSCHSGISSSSSSSSSSRLNLTGVTFESSCTNMPMALRINGSGFSIQEYEVKLKNCIENLWKG